MDFLSKNLPTISKFLAWTKKEVTTTWASWYGDNSSSSVSSANLIDNNKNWVYVCVDKISDSVSAIQIKMMKYNKNGEDTEIFDHPALDLLDRPNEQMTGRDFRYVTMSYLELTGNAYWLKDQPMNPTSLFPINPRSVTPKIGADGMSIDSYKYRSATVSGAAAETIYSKDIIIHLKYPNPRNPLIGRGTLEPIAEWVDVDNYATEFNRRFFLNSATFGGAIETEAGNQDALEKARLSFENNHKGLQNAHKFLFLPKGSKLNDQAITPKDMQMQEADSTFRDKILAGFGVPKSVVGIVEDVNRANAESSNYVFSSFTVKPKMDRLITYLNEFYLPMFKGTDQMYFTYDDPTPENATLEIQENQAALGNSPYKTVNEVRADKGLAPVDGGDVVMTLSTLMPIGLPEESVPDEGVEPEPAKTFRKSRSPRIDRVGRAVDTIVEKAAEFYKSNVQNVSFEVQHKDFINRVTTYEQQFEVLVRDFDRKQHQELLGKLGSLDLTKEVSPTQIFNKEAEIEKMIKFATPLIKKLSKDQGERATELVNKQQLNNFLRKDYSVTSRLLHIIEASIKRMARSYVQTTLDLIVVKLNDGIKDGDSIDEITASITEVYGLSEKYRANRIARTEVFSAANDASKDAYIASGVVKTIRWKTAEDELTCPFCAPLDNKIIDVDDDFFEKGTTLTGDDGEKMSVDYENIGNPPLHPQCRCFILPEVISVKSAEPEHSSEFLLAVEKMLHEE